MPKDSALQKTIHPPDTLRHSHASLNTIALTNRWKKNWFKFWFGLNKYYKQSKQIKNIFVFSPRAKLKSLYTLKKLWTVSQAMTYSSVAKQNQNEIYEWQISDQDWAIELVQQHLRALGAGRELHLMLTKIESNIWND